MDATTPHSIYFPPNPILGARVWGPNGRLWEWDGGKWEAIGAGWGPDACGPEYTGHGFAMVGTVAPDDPGLGTLWFNTNTDTLMCWDGGDWIAVAPPSPEPVNPITVGPTPPDNPQSGFLWFNTTTNVMSIYTGTAWDPIQTAGSVATGDTSPANPQAGQLWLDGSGDLWVWDGNDWIQVTQTAPDASIIVSPTQPPNATIGLLWHNTSTGTLNVFDGTAWVAIGPGGITTSTSAPTGVVAGALWLNPNTDVLSVWDGAAWVVIGSPPPVPSASIYVGPTQPASPTLGMLWHNTTTGILSVWDGTSWVAVGPAGVVSANVAPANPIIGQMWLNTTTGVLSVWDGAGWVAVSTPSTELGNGGTINGNLAITGNASVGGNLNVTGSINGKVALTGITDGSDAAMGQVGEYVTFTMTSTGSGIQTGTMPISAGDWDISGWLVASQQQTCEIGGAPFSGNPIGTYLGGAGSVVTAIPTWRVNQTTNGYPLEIRFYGGGEVLTLNARRIR